jgi:hypothetical protein
MIDHRLVWPAASLGPRPGAGKALPSGKEQKFPMVSPSKVSLTIA